MITYKRMEQYAESNPSRWHTPGHKGRLCGVDITEIGDEFPGSAVTDAQAKAAQFFQSKYCRFLVGGSSMGIKAAILSVGGDILIESRSHQAVREGAALARVNAIEIRNDYTEGLYQPLSVPKLTEAMDQNPHIQAVVVTDPDYYGLCGDADGIARLVKERGKLLIADSAHGAHFAARMDLFPKSYARIADFCNLSAHKTMPAYTQSAYLCVNNARYIEKVDANLALLGTTSPSYLLLGGLEYAIDYTAAHRKAYDALYEAAGALKAKYCTLDNQDFTRIVLDAHAYGTDAKSIFDGLRERNVVCEKYDARYVILIAVLMDDAENFLRLDRALEDVLRTERRDDNGKHKR